MDIARWITAASSATIACTLAWHLLVSPQNSAPVMFTNASSSALDQCDVPATPGSVALNLDTFEVIEVQGGQITAYLRDTDGAVTVAAASTHLLCMTNNVPMTSIPERVQVAFGRLTACEREGALLSRCQIN